MAADILPAHIGQNRLNFGKHIVCVTDQPNRPFRPQRSARAYSARVQFIAWRNSAGS